MFNTPWHTMTGGGVCKLPYNPAKVGLELKRVKVKLRQPSQREGRHEESELATACHSLLEYSSKQAMVVEQAQLLPL